MNIQIIVLTSTLLLSACSDRPESASEKNARHYDEKMLAMGDRTYNTHCATCHGYKGEGQPGWRQPGPDGKLLPPPLDNHGRSWRLSRSQIQQFILHGSPDGRGNMPAWKDKLTAQEINALTIWITSLWSDQIYLDWQTITEHGAQ